MPTTRKESLQFGFMMCFGMVLVMTIYNFYLNDMFGTMTFMQSIGHFCIAFVIAFALDMYLVGPIAKKIAMKITAKSKKIIIKVLTISICMVLGMAFFMSIYGVLAHYVSSGAFSTSSFFTDYVQVFQMNLLLALPLQIIIMGPLVRFLFGKFVKPSY